MLNKHIGIEGFFFFIFLNYFYDIFSVSVHNRMLYVKHTHFFPYFLSTIDQKGRKKWKMKNCHNDVHVYTKPRTLKQVRIYDIINIY